MTEEPASTRDLLIAAAGELLAQGGIAAVTLREVGRRSGVSHNAPYKHFADKEALLAAVAAADLRRREADLAGALTRRSPAKALRTVLADYVQDAVRQTNLFKLTFGPWTVESAELAQAAAAMQARFVELVRRAQQATVLPDGDPTRLAILVHSFAHGLADLAASGHLADKASFTHLQLLDDLLGFLRQAATR